MIGNISNKKRYSVLSTTPISSYEIPFKYWDVAQIVVKLTDAAGSETTVGSGNYTVSTPGETGTLSFASGYLFPEGTEILTIVRVCTVEQLTDFRNGDVMDAEIIEDVLDFTVALLQQMDEKVARAVVIPISDPDSDMQVPSALVRKGMLLGFDEDGVLTVILTSDIEQKLAQALAAQDDAVAKATEALNSAISAASSASNSYDYAQSSFASKNAAATSASEASASASAANASKEAAASSEAAALASKNAASTSEENSLTSKNASDASAIASAASASQAAISEANALASKNAAALSESNAATSKTGADASASQALASKNAAALSETNAAGSASDALASKNAAAISESNAAASETNAAQSKTDAALSEANALAHAQSAQLADASANKQILVDGVLNQYGLSVVSGRVYFNYEEVI